MDGWCVYINIFVGAYKYSGEAIPALLFSQAQLYFLSSMYVYLQLYISFCLYMLGYSESIKGYVGFSYILPVAHFMLV